MNRARAPRLAASLAFAFASTVVAAFTARPASASPTFDLAGAQTGTGGLSAQTTGASAASTYFDPALLTDAEEGVVAGVTTLSEQIGMTLDGRRGGDVPLVVGGRDLVGPDGQPASNATVPTEWLEAGCTPGKPGAGECPTPGFPARPRQRSGSSGKTRTYLTLGAVKHVVPKRFSLGFYAMLPFGDVMTARSFFVDEREQFFTNSLHPELYGDRLTALSIAFGGGLAVTERLSVGLGVSIAIQSAADARTYVRDTSNYDTLLMTTDVGVGASVSPVLAARYRLAQRLSLAATAHAPESFEVDMTFSAALPSGVESRAARTMVHGYVPWRFGLGAELRVVDAPRRGFSVTLGASYALWSTYRDRNGERPADAWSDVLTPTLGLRHRLGDARVYTDLQWAPSPVPEQTGRSSYVDSDRVGLALGGDVALSVFGVRFRPGLSLLVHRVTARHHTKEDARMVDEVEDDVRNATTGAPIGAARGLNTNSPGWPGYASKGWVYGGTVSLAIPF